MSLTTIQAEILRLIARHTHNTSFVLAGGGAVLAHNITQRSTRDLDLFTNEPSEVPPTARAITATLTSAGYTVTPIKATNTFASFNVTAPNATETLIELATDYRLAPPVQTEYGPTLSLHDLAADKLLALFGRTEPRDVVDLNALIDHIPLDTAIELATQKDPGYQHSISEANLERIARRPHLTDDERSAVDNLHGRFTARNLHQRQRPSPRRSDGLER